MRHAVLLLLVLLGGYAAWHVAAPRDRKKVRALVKQHGWYVVLVFVVLALAVAAAAAIQSIQFI